ncbi:MAG: hypothetical protein GXO75_02160, partial [Calditrichaeota bacterium]|nr:hypothetical protein [Calditrichota bacterium]
AGLAIAILTFLNITFFAEAFSAMPWEMRGLPASVPYLNMMLLNTIQAIIAVFLASDFLKRDTKLNTTEVIYMRSMTNGDYVLGKLLGILEVFIGLNLFVLVIAAVINVVFADVPLNLLAFIYYLLILSFPTLIFIIGLSFIGMILLRNQALTFIILLGYIAVTLFFLTNKLNSIFDYMGFWLPLAYSDFVGFADLNGILLQRGIYLLLGLGFIFMTIYGLKRLPQSRFLIHLSLGFSLVFLGGGIFLGILYYSHYTGDKLLRTQMIQQNDQLMKEAIVSVTACNIDLDHLGKEIAVTAKLTFKNENPSPLKQYIFSLNPGLRVNKVSRGGKELPFSRERHILVIKPNQPLPSGGLDSVDVQYSGKIAPSASYLDINDENFYKIHHLFIYKVPKEYSFLTPNYVLLTHENLWYPVPGPTFGSKIFTPWKKDFIDFTLTVKTKKSLIPISQGMEKKLEDDRYRFHPRHPLPQLSLVIGKYEKKSVQVDSVEYNLYTFPGHDYYKPYVNALGDTLAVLIREAKRDFEGQIDSEYPYPSLSLVEVPSQFYAHARRFGFVQETIQPEQVFVQENGVFMRSADFKLTFKRIKDMNKRMNRTVSDRELQTGLFNRFAREFTSGSTGPRFRRRFSPFSYSIFPDYYSFVNHLSSKKWPVLDFSFESYLSAKLSEASSPFSRFFRGITDEEKATLVLQKKSLANIIRDPDLIDQIKPILKVKSNYLFDLIKSEIGPEKFEGFLKETLLKYRFTNLDATTLSDELRKRYAFNLQSQLDLWYAEKNLPGFLIFDFKNYSLLDVDRTRYQVEFTVANLGKVQGLVSLQFRARRSRGFGRGFFGSPPPPLEERLVAVDAGQAKRVGVLLDEEPRGMSINTLVAKNLPLEISERFEDFKLNEKALPFDGEKVLEKVPSFTQPGEIVVDNEDEGFHADTQIKQSLLQRLLKIKKNDEEEYVRFSFWRPPVQWRKTTFSNFYGKFIHSACFTKSGKGGRVASWNARLPASGQYDVYCYNSRVRLPWGRRGRRREYIGDHNFIIYHDDGVEHVTMNPKKSDEGWTFLGTFYMSAGDAKIELTNKSTGRTVIADAVKWVKR